MTDIAADIASRPAWLKPFALLDGYIVSAPLDLADRMEQVYARLKSQGWTVVVKSIGTDFAGPGGLPVPKAQPLTMYMNRTDHPYTPLEAKIALATTLLMMNLSYNVIGAYAGEVQENIVRPTVDQTLDFTRKGLELAPWIIGGVGAIYGLMLLSQLKSR